MSTAAKTYAKTDTILTLDKISLSYGDKQILRDVDAVVKEIVRPDAIQGQVVGFLGPSGIGKSQLSRIIAGLQAPTSGTVKVGVEQVPTHKGLVGMVAQNYILFDWATVMDNLLIAGKQAGLSKAAGRDKANTFIERFSLGDYLKLYPRQLSGGTRQRVAIAQQLMCSEHFLIMDEPFSGLDMVMKARTCQLITEVANLDSLNTIIVVTHDITEAASISDTLWLMGHERNETVFTNTGKTEYLTGARLVENYDLAAMGLCWQPDILSDRDFQEFVLTIKQRFATLKQF